MFIFFRFFKSRGKYSLQKKSWNVLSFMKTHWKFMRFLKFFFWYVYYRSGHNTFFYFIYFPFYSRIMYVRVYYIQYILYILYTIHTVYTHLNIMSKFYRIPKERENRIWVSQIMNSFVYFNIVHILREMYVTTIYFNIVHICIKRNVCNHYLF